MDKITTETQTNGIRPLMLTRYGNTVTCPFSTKIPLVEGTLEKRIRIETQPCWELCPHFNVLEYDKNEKKINIEITCGSSLNLIRAIITDSTAPANSLQISGK